MYIKEVTLFSDIDKFTLIGIFQQKKQIMNDLLVAKK